MDFRSISAFLILVAANFLALPAMSEPYIAVMKSMKCMTCHTNPTGGGKRNVYGNMFAQYEFSETYYKDLLPDSAQATDQPTGIENKGDEPEVWTGELGRFVSLGGDMRSSVSAINIPNQDDEFKFELDETLIYLEIKLIKDRLSLYLDERVAPNTAFNRESYGLYWLDNKKYYIKMGQFFLPYGLRIEDDFAFIRQETGINYFKSESGIETGLELEEWSGSFSLTEGDGSGTGKRYSLLISFIKPGWRIGSSFNFNNSDTGNRRMGNIFAGLNTGSITWLSEIDYINDGDMGVKQRIGFLEANVRVWKGHNFKFTFEYLDPDIDVSEDEQVRNSIVWEYTPIQFVQTRTGIRIKNGINTIDSQNTDELFAQLHLYF